MQADTILFDLDGTLVDTAGDLTRSLNVALRELGRPEVQAATVRRMVGGGARMLMEKGLAESGGGTADELERGLDCFLGHYAANLVGESRPFADADRVLGQLRAAGFRLAICTNKPIAMAHDLLGQLKLDRWFGAVLGGDSLPYKKPDPRHVFETLQAVGGQRAIFIGDSPTDAEAAHRARMPLVLMRYGYSLVPVAELGADVVLDRLIELPAAIAAIQGTFKEQRAGNKG